MQATLRIELRSRTGDTLAVREAHNAVMRGGAELVARCFAGQGPGITHMGVGTSDAPETDIFATAALTNDPGEPLTGATEAPLAAEVFAFETDATRRVVRVRLRGALPAAAAVGTVREAGLLSRTEAGAVLYNRVIFPPMQKGNDHELTLFWEIAFPYGDLQALA